MSSRTRKRSALVLLAGVTLLAVACTSQQPGRPTAAGAIESPPVPESPGSSAAVSSPGQPSGLDELHACELLTGEQAVTLGVPARGEPDEILGRCDWLTPEGGVATAIDAEHGVDELNLTDASSVTDVVLGRHRAKRVVEISGSGYCSIVFAITERSNVDVTGLYLGDTPRACAAVDQAAEFIEPKLP